MTSRAQLFDLKVFYEGYCISDVRKEYAVILSIGNTVKDAVAEMMAMSVNCVVVEENGTYVGILTGKDMLRLISTGKDISSIKLSDEMDYPIHTVEAITPVHEAVRVMARKEIHKAVVVDENGSLTGTVSLSYLLSMLEKKCRGFLEEQILEKEKMLERKAMVLEETRSELSIIYDNSPMIMIIVDRDRRVQKVNLSAVRFTGRAAEEMIGLRGGEALRCIHSVDDPRGCGFGNVCCSCPVRRIVIDTFETGRSHNKVEVRLRLAIKEEELVFLVSTALFIVPQGERVLVYFEDITELKQIEEENRTSEEKCRLILNTSPVGGKNDNINGVTVFTERDLAAESLKQTSQLLENILDNTHVMIAHLDRNFNFIKVNRAYAEADEKEISFFNGKNHFALYPDKENEAVFRNVVGSGKPYFAFAKPFEYTEHPERGVSYWDWSLIPIINDSGLVMELVFTLSNVTKSKQAEDRLKMSLREKEVLLREANHRVKKNLQLIYSMLNLQKEYAGDKKASEVIEEYQDRIRVISIVHENLYQSEDLANINLRSYINGLVSKLFRYFEVGSGRVILNVEVEDIFLEVGHAIPFGLIVSELLADSLQHTCPGNGKSDIQIKVCTIEKNWIELVMSSSCTTMPGAYSSFIQRSFGLQVVDILVKHLKGEMKIEKDAGNKFFIKFRSGK